MFFANKDLNFSRFLTQSYHMTLEELNTADYFYDTFVENDSRRRAWTCALE